MAAPDPTTIGRYEVVSRLGLGGMGSLYLAKDPKIGRLVAIKLVRQEFDTPDARQRFAREAQSAGTLRHPNIVTIFDVDEHEGLPFIAMEYIDGETLGEIVKRKALVPVTKKLSWVEDLCAGLAYAHRQGVIHRDIKPANLMVDTEGTLKILDFGLARRDASKFTQSHIIIGTPNYMSPEQIRGVNIDTRSDIFSVGALLYEVLTYKEAFPGAVHQTMHKILHEEPEPLDMYVPSLDPAVQRILDRALAKDRDGRYPDLSQMKNDLTEVRQRMEAVVNDTATTPLSKEARFISSDDVVARTSPVPPAGSRPGSGGAKRSHTNRQSLQRRRSEQISSLLDEARKLFEHGDLDKARDKCDEALMFDPDHPGGLQLMDDIAAEADRKQLARFIADARAELQKGQLDSSEALVAQARQLRSDSTDVYQLQEAIDTARREVERTRQIQEIMRRARTRFAEGGFEAAIRAAGEVLAIDPENAAARELQRHSQDAIDLVATRAQADAAAQHAVTAARQKLERGDAAGAIADLEAFAPAHDLVSAFLATLRREALDRTATGAASPDRSRSGTRVPAAGAPDRSLSGTRVPAAAAANRSLSGTRVPPAGAADRSLSGIRVPAAGPATHETAHGSKPAPGPTEDVPQRSSVMVVAIAFIVIVVTIAAAFYGYSAVESPSPASGDSPVAPRPADSSAPQPSPGQPADNSPSSAQADAPPVTSPAALTAKSATPTPEVLGEAERPAIARAIQQWAAAFERRDVRALSRVRELSDAEKRNWQKTFNNMASYKMTVRITDTPRVIDNDALVPVQEIVAYTSKLGTGAIVDQPPVNTSYRLRKAGTEWRLLAPTTPMPKGSR
jgi:serine/threonine protein kinase